jgi:hypothetical protein
MVQSAAKGVFRPEDIPIIKGLLLLLAGAAHSSGTDQRHQITRELADWGTNAK